MRVFLTRQISQLGVDILLQAGAEIRVGQVEEEQALPRAELLTGAAWADGLLCLLTEDVDQKVLAAGGGRLLGLATMAVGFNNIDVEAATALGLPVSNTPGILTETTADCVWAMLLALARRLPEAESYMREGRYRLWGPNLFLGSDIGPGADGAPKTLGILGFGRIGQAVARRAQGFEMKVLAHDPNHRSEIEASSWAAWAELPEILAESDFLSLHVPLTPTTHHLIAAEELTTMKSSALLINTARGPVVDESALVDALRRGEIAGAALDVYEEEPAMAPGLAELPNVLLLPHIASASRDTRGRMARMAAENLLAHLRRQRAPNVVNPEVYGTEAYIQRSGG